jgi:DnaJ-class molecular chaperone
MKAFETKDVEKIKPNTIPFKCPNCNGYGLVGYAKKVCHSCGGKGVVFVPQVIDENYEIPPNQD